MADAGNACPDTTWHDALISAAPPPPERYRLPFDGSGVRIRPGAFSEDECERIRFLRGSVPMRWGRLGRSRDSRKSIIGPVRRDADSEWLFTRLWEIALESNAAEFGFDLVELETFAQYTEYPLNGHMGWHIDSGIVGFLVRKLSLVVHVSSPSEFEGGELEWFDIGTGIRPPQGSVSVFPTYLHHRVLPVTAGSRTTLVAWAVGPAFR